MRVCRCTIDSSCVIALDHLDLVPKLSFLFSIVLVPKAVREELFKRRAAKDRLQNLFDTYAFFQRCDGYERGTVDFLLAERNRQGAEDRGEVEAVVQASDFGATVLVDDPGGRELIDGLPRQSHSTATQRYKGIAQF
jgi:predicted nucleic acid-binding protein